MYVQWLLEFVWRLFIQGPLLIINFFTSDNVLTNLTSNIGFNINSDYGIINSLISVSIVFSFALVLIIFVFLYKLFKVMITSNHNYTKIQLIEVFKEFAKTILITLVFVLIFQLVFACFDVLMNVFNKVYDKANTKSNFITNILYSLITGQNLTKDNQYFLFPDKNFLTIMDSMNFLVSIILVMSFAFFLIWMVWSIYQKMLEIMFLYITFPISLAFGQESEKLSWKIWTKEIFNKFMIIFLLLVCIRLYCYGFYMTYQTIIKNVWKTNDQGKLYISLIYILATGSCIMFATKFIANRNKENIGIIGSFSSFKQTRNFITNKQVINNNDNNSYQVSINENINTLKSDIRRLRYEQNENIASLRKIKLFNK